MKIKKLFQFNFLSLNKISPKNSVTKYLSMKSYFNYPCPRKLRELVKLSVFEKENAESIKDIWKTYHSMKPKVFSDVVEKNLMETILTK
jgi:hypothetical protein